MLDLIKKSLEAAIGGITLTQEKMKELADELVVRGHLSKKEGSDLLKELKSIAKDNQRKVGEVIEGQVRKVMKDMGVATSSDVKALKGRIAALEKELEKAKKKAPPKKTKKS
jgi:polyhydroxyalkanoate synthesis regulator phasin